MIDVEWAPSGRLLVGTMDFGGTLGIGSLTLDGTFALPVYPNEFMAQDPSW